MKQLVNYFCQILFSHFLKDFKFGQSRSHFELQVQIALRYRLRFFTILLIKGEPKKVCHVFFSNWGENLLQAIEDKSLTVKGAKIRFPGFPAVRENLENLEKGLYKLFWLIFREWNGEKMKSVPQSYLYLELKMGPPVKNQLTVNNFSYPKIILLKIHSINVEFYKLFKNVASWRRGLETPSYKIIIPLKGLPPINFAKNLVTLVSFYLSTRHWRCDMIG